MNKKIVDAKKKVVKELEKEIEGSESTFIVEYRGLSVAKLAELRKELRKEDSDMKVYKNSLVRRAATNLGYEDLTKELVGPNAFVFVKKNPAAGARVLTKFAKLNNKLVLKGAVVEKAVVTNDEVKVLSKLGSKEELISKFLGCLKSPMTKFALTLDAVAKNK